jgi:uncharacterized repeat protein (TIGR02543 family)
MKKNVCWAAMLSIVLALGLVLIGCGDPDGGPTGGGGEQTGGGGDQTGGGSDQTGGSGDQTGGSGTGGTDTGGTGGSGTGGTDTGGTGGSGAGGTDTDGTGGSGGDVTTYTVTFDADGGSPTPASKTIDSGSTLGTLPTAPKKSGNTFGGWFTQKNGGGTQYTASTKVTGDITLYAKWTAEAATEYTVDQAIFNTSTTKKSGSDLVFNWTLKISGKTPNGLYTYKAPDSIVVSIQSEGVYIDATTLGGSARTYTLKNYANYVEDDRIYLRVKCVSTYGDKISYIVYRPSVDVFTPNYP